MKQEKLKMSLRNKISTGLLIVCIVVSLVLGITKLDERSYITKGVSSNVVIEGEGYETFVDFFTGETVRQKIQWVGSGVIVSKNGIVVTAGHCVKGATKLKVTLSDGRFFYKTNSYYNYFHDVGFIKLPISMDKYSPFGYSNELEAGEKIYTIGNIYGIWDGSIRWGKVYKVHFTRNLLGTTSEFILTKLDVVGGNSGGAVYRNGKVIGIVSMGGRGACFVVPSTTIVKLLNKFGIKPAVNHLN